MTKEYSASRRKLMRFSLAVFGAVSTTSAWSQESYPSKPVRMIIPTPPGQGADIFGRLLADQLTSVWGQQVFVDNRAGGAGVPAMVAAKAARPDGYTIILGTTSTLAINPTLHADLP